MSRPSDFIPEADASDVNPTMTEVQEYSSGLDANPITKEKAQDLFIAYVESTCCWGSGPAKSMKIDDLEIKASILAVQRTFIECRE